MLSGTVGENRLFVAWKNSRQHKVGQFDYIDRRQDTGLQCRNRESATGTYGPSFAMLTEASTFSGVGTSGAPVIETLL